MGTVEMALVLSSVEKLEGELFKLRTLVENQANREMDERGTNSLGWHRAGVDYSVRRYRNGSQLTASIEKSG